MKEPKITFSVIRHTPSGGHCILRDVSFADAVSCIIDEMNGFLHYGHNCSLTINRKLLRCRLKVDTVNGYITYKTFKHYGLY